MMMVTKSSVEEPKLLFSAPAQLQPYIAFAAPAPDLKHFWLHRHRNTAKKYVPYNFGIKMLRVSLLNMRASNRSEPMSR